MSYTDMIFLAVAIAVAMTIVPPIVRGVPSFVTDMRADMRVQREESKVRKAAEREAQVASGKRQQEAKAEFDRLNPTPVWYIWLLRMVALFLVVSGIYAAYVVYLYPPKPHGQPVYSIKP